MIGLLKLLGSALFTVIISVVLIALLTASTFLESVHGTEFAQKVFYQTRWFDGIFFLLCINIFCSTVLRFPFQKKHIGFLITHIAILVLLAGAFISKNYGTEGEMSLAEGETANAMQQMDLPTVTALPFSLTLKQFRKIDYPGTMSAAAFESDVTLRDLHSGSTFERTISMNHPLSYAGYKVFQSSYFMDEQHAKISVFSVAHNPGILWIYIGSVLACCGAMVQFYGFGALAGERHEEDVKSAG
ncbi:MAG: cytochrome c biogenesis protein ResB [Candidatus Omnitrophica bacterium]|nr:cytochrome c biogenesis protein ResB [Candidatus Omnitrophota bacterium]